MFQINDIYTAINDGASLERVCRQYGGFSLYIPQQRPDYKECIIEEFNGYNYNELAYKYNTTPKNVRIIIKKHKEDEKPKEKSLF